MDKSKVKIVYRKISELKEPDYNPRKITAKQREDIKKSLQQFGFVQPLVVNIHEDRFGIIVGGNQRKKIAESMGYDEAPCIEVSLDLEKEKELNLRLNKNQAEFDYGILTTFFDKTFLFDVGFTEKELGKIQSEFEEKFNSIKNENAEMPIVPKFSERYGCVIIPFTNDLDENWIRNVLSLEKAKDYKNERMGIPFVISMERFQKIWENATNPVNY